MQWDSLHSKTKAALPPGGIAPKRYMVGVLKPEAGSKDQLTEFDFVWMKAHAKIPVSTIRKQWAKRCPGTEFELEYRHEVPADDTIVRNLNYYGDDLIVFRVVDVEKKGLSPLNTVLRPAPVNKGEPIEEAAHRQPVKIEKPHGESQSQLSTQPPMPYIGLQQGNPSLAGLLGSYLHASSIQAIMNSAVGNTMTDEQIRSLRQIMDTAPEARNNLSKLTELYAAKENVPGVSSGPRTSKMSSASTLPTSNGRTPAPSWDTLRDHQRPSVEPVDKKVFLHPPRHPNESTLPLNGDLLRPRTSTHDSSSLGVLPARPSYPPHQSPHGLLVPSVPVSHQLDARNRKPISHHSNHARASSSQTGNAQSEPQGSHPVKAERRSPSPSRTPEPGAAEFDAEGAFNRDPSPDAEGGAEIVPTDEHLRDLIELKSPELLEAGVAKAIEVLDAFKTIFEQHKATSADANAWLQSIEQTKAKAERTRTIVGVVGNTGAGKSSVINAMLDEERLVPTNCMRACTAVVTELSWNDNEEPDQRYRAEIEFIGRSDWEKELKILIQEFLTENGTLSREASDQNTDAGIAWAKFHAVYPKIHKDQLDGCTVERLMAERSVLSVLDTTKRINNARPDDFYTQLQHYVDSKEKTTGKKDQKKPPSSTEFWPLIKVVKIYTRAPALSTGAVIVDLPGVHDSNAARAAVADRYIKQCTGLWIVAPITRAVDDKAAKKLLGDSFRRQLQLDGGYSSVTFICSKTDDISITEATSSLDLQDQISDLDDQQADYEKEIDNLNDKIAELKETILVYRVVMDEADTAIETWEDLKDDANDGKTVFAPVQKQPSKRKRGISKRKSSKRRKAEEDDSDVEYISSENDSNGSEIESDSEDVQAPRSPLTLGEIKQKLEELKLSKKNARQEKALVSHHITELRPKIKEIKEKIAGLRLQMSAICIAGRNEYSKGAIQNDFAAGIKELDQENQAEKDEEAFNPDEDFRDYDEVARSLPVFCISSRAYQKMSGRLKKDENVPGFTTPEETGMPQLQAHCKKLTEARRVQACEKFLPIFAQQLTTFQLWASNDGTGLNLNDDDKRKQVKYLETRLKQLSEGLEKAVTACLTIMKTELRTQIFDRFPEAIEEAAKVAPETAQRWGFKNAGGLVWASYKAVCRREGVYKSASAGHRDFNAELMDPILRRGATAWERAFQRRLPEAIQAYTKDAGKVLTSFHSKIEERARSNGVGLASLSMLKASIARYEQIFQAVAIDLLHAMQEAQKDANREFVPIISQFMRQAYDLCTNERGPGSFMRMKDHMVGHVDSVRHHMFTKATKTVEKHIGKMCKDLEELMAKKSDEIFAMMRADYMQVLGGVQISDDTMSRQDMALRAETKTILKSVDPQFERIVNGELDGDKDKDKADGNDENKDEGHQEDKEEDEWVHVAANGEVQGDGEEAASMVDSHPNVDHDETMQDALDDTVITEPSPAKGVNNKSDSGEL